MTLDEAIKHCEEKAKEIRKANEEMPTDCKLSEDLCECAREHEQLAGWLTDYKRLLEMPKGDLISREALKTDLRQYFTDGVLDGVSAKLAFNQILHDIDNAPTVNIKDQIAGAYNEGYMCGSREAEKARPHGEYIRVDNLWAKCSICGNLTRTIKKYNMPNFCPACGADMRKGGAE